MVTKAEFSANVDTLTATLAEVTAKLDLIADAVNKLEAGSVLTQEELDGLNEAVVGAVDAAKGGSAKATDIIDDAGNGPEGA